MSDNVSCKHCAARFEGDGAEKAYKAHLDGFHPSGAPVERLVTTPAAVAAVGKDFGPAVQGIATDLGDIKTTVDDHEERLKALEEGRRSDVDLQVLADQVAPRLGQPAPAPVVETPAVPERIPYADLQVRAKELDIPAVGTYEALQAAIAAEDLRLANAALAARSGEGNQGGDGSPASDPAASVTGEAGTPPAK